MTSLALDQPAEVSDFGRLVLPSGHTVVFDAADRAIVDSRRWCASTRKRSIYAQSAGSGRPTVLMHRLITAAPAGMMVDHRNGDGLDNRRANLRLVTAAQNAANARLSRANRSGYRGVSQFTAASAETWQAYITVDGKRQHLGFFPTAWAAAEAYNAAASSAWGECARLNERQPS